MKPADLASSTFGNEFNDLQKENLIRLHRRLKQFGNIESHISNNQKSLANWISNKTEELPVLYEEENKGSDIWVAAQKLLLEQALRPSRVVDASRQFVASIFGADFDQSELTCGDVVQQVQPNQPIILARVYKLN